MKTLLKAVGYLAAFALIALVCYALTLYFRWEWWVGLALFLLLAGIVLGFGWIRRHVARLVSRRRGEDAGKPKPAAPPAPGRVSDLVAQWKKGIATLKASGLSQRGNPLYALPWIAVLGSTGAGKSTAMQRARLVGPQRLHPWCAFHLSVVLGVRRGGGRGCRRRSWGGRGGVTAGALC